MKVEELLIPRYQVMIKVPLNRHKVGDVIYGDGDWYSTHRSQVDVSCSAYPDVYKLLNWWEERTLDEMMSVNYVRITIYTGYWRVGDVVKVTDYKIDTKNKKLLLYILDASHQSLPERCEPATLDEYKADEIKRKTC